MSCHYQAALTTPQLSLLGKRGGMIPYMDRAAHAVREWIAGTGLSSAAVARRAGVSASTLHRIINNQVDPAVGTLTEIAAACGLDMDLTTRPLSSPLAAAAVRSLLEESYPSPTSLDVQQWVQRLQRMAAGSEPLDLVRAAASASSPLHRPSAVLLSGQVTVGRLASAGDASQGQWALSGAAGLYLPPHADPAPAVTILWCEDARRTASLLSDAMTPTDRRERASIAVIAAEPELFTGAFQQGIVRYAAPLQIIVDCLSQGGRVADDALTEGMTW